MHARVPSAVSQSWLKTLGFKSNHDRSLIPVLRQIGFVDQARTPTERWRRYRCASAPKVLGQGVREGYADIFKVCANAHAWEEEDLERALSARVQDDTQVISKTVETFQALAAEADFSDIHTETIIIPPPKIELTHEKSNLHDDARRRPAPTLHIDMQIQISPETSPQQIAQIFASMAKHLNGREA